MTLRLQCAEIIHALQFKPVIVCTPPNGDPVILDAKDQTHRKLVKRLVSQIEQARKYLFDSGSDQDEESLTAVKQTAVNMIDAGLFHQPFPIMWIEDPYEENPEAHRNFYLTIEKPDCIQIWFFSKVPVGGKKFPKLIFNACALEIDLRVAEDKWRVSSPVNGITPFYGHVLGEAVYAFKKLIVTLNTAERISEPVTVPKGKRAWNGDPRTKPYDYTLVRIPYDTADGMPSHSGGGQPHSGVRRRRLIAGYTWGKHERPVEQQRWIKPHWRHVITTRTQDSTHHVVQTG